MSIDAATAFMSTHARLLDRRRFELFRGGGDPDGVLAAVAAYRNADGGYGWGLEPDLRSSTSQPAGALHAFEAFLDVGPVVTPGAAALCDWLTSVSLPDGGLPFALPLTDPAGCAPFWTEADPAVSSLQITAIVAAFAHRIARYDPAVAEHPWLTMATDHCWTAIEALLAEPTAPPALVLGFAVRLLDAAHDAVPRSAELLDGLASFIPADGLLPVEGGKEGEALRPLDIAPDPGGPARRYFTDATVSAELDRLAAQQRPDGGWPVDFASYSPAAELEWRGHATVAAMAVLRSHGRA